MAEEEGVQLLQDASDEKQRAGTRGEVRALRLVKERLQPHLMTPRELEMFPVDRYSLRREMLVVGVIFGVHAVLLAGICACTPFVNPALWPSVVVLVGLGLLPWVFNLVTWLHDWPAVAATVFRVIGALCGVAHVLALLPFVIAHRGDPGAIFGTGSDTFDHYRATIALFVLNSLLVVHAILFARSPWRPLGDAGCCVGGAPPENEHYDVLVSTGATGNPTYRVSFRERVMYAGYLEEFEALPFRGCVNGGE